MKTSHVLLESNLPGVALRARGKVRDIYEVGDDLLIVATDRISAFDCVMPVGIPHKGETLNRLSVFWFNRLRHLVPNHLITAEVSEYPALLRMHSDQVSGRSMLVRKAKMLPIECVARGYLSGSGWKEYQRSGGVCGISLPAGLSESEKLPEPIFTPATKAETGHDENISFEQAAKLVGTETARQVREMTLRLYSEAARYSAARGIIIADTKFEFGYIGGDLVLADEALTPDSSRFWPTAEYRPGGPQPSYDKQFLRDYLESVGWNKQPPAPMLPDDVVRKTSDKYQEAYRVLTGELRLDS